MRDVGAEQLLSPGTITREARRGDVTERTTIDLIFATETLTNNLTKCDVNKEIEQSSDHLPIATWFNLDTTIEGPAKRTLRAWKRTNPEKFIQTFKENLGELETQPLETEQQINQVIASLTQAINTAINTSTPWAKQCEFSNSYWNDECQDAVKNTRKLRRTYTQTHTEVAWREYVSAKDRKGKTIAKAKRAYFRERMREAGESPEKLWRVASWASRRAKGEKPQISIPTLQKDD
jgi:hypothetical protein